MPISSHVLPIDRDRPNSKLPIRIFSLIELGGCDLEVIGPFIEPFSTFSDEESRFPNVLPLPKCKVAYLFVLWRCRVSIEILLNVVFTFEENVMNRMNKKLDSASRMRLRIIQRMRITRPTHLHIISYLCINECIYTLTNLHIKSSLNSNNKF